MTNPDIETFFAVLQHGTLSAAAEALYISQPTLTARMQALEGEVGAIARGHLRHIEGVQIFSQRLQ